VKRTDDYPDLSGFLDYLTTNGFTEEILNRLIDRHTYNHRRTKDLYERYKCYEDKVPIFQREPRFKDDNLASLGLEQLNNRLSHDFFGEINDVMIGYFAGKAASYSYSRDQEAEVATGGTEQVDQAQSALSDFITKNNFYDLNQEVTKYASVCGYAGRLFYVNKDGEESCMVVPPFECFVITSDKVQAPEFAVRYYDYKDMDGSKRWKAEGYDNTNVYYYEGTKGAFHLVRVEPHLFDYCPLQLIPLNGEMMSSAERVLTLIDEYDRTVSDNANDAEGNTQALQVFDGVDITELELAKAKMSGSIHIPIGFQGSQHSVYYLQKAINDGFNEHHLDRLERNIYRFSKTPNLNDQAFGTASGISLKFKLTAFEAKCGAFEAKISGADTYMFKVIGSAFQKKGISFDYLQAYSEYKRNFPVDIASEANAVQALINAGVPDEIAYNYLSFVDDINYLLDLKEQSKKDALDPFEPEDDRDGGDDTNMAGKNNPFADREVDDGDDEPR